MRNIWMAYHTNENVFKTNRIACNIQFSAKKAILTKYGEYSELAANDILLLT